MGEDSKAVLRLQAYRFELITSDSKFQQLSQFAGSCRWVTNHALALQTEFFALCGVHIGYADLCTVLVEWKQDPETVWLNGAPSQALQQALKNLEAGWSRHFDSLRDLKRGKIGRGQLVSKPVFKKGGQRDSFRYPQGTVLEQHNNRIFLPKLGWIRYRNSRDVLGTVKNVTVSRSAGRWFISIQTEREVKKPVHASSSALGIDAGVVNFAALSTGEFIAPLNSFSQHALALAHAQQIMSRKIKFSNNWKKAKRKVQLIQVHIANARLDFLHKLSTRISKSHAIVCIEDLRIQNMTRSAAGTIDNPGTNVAAKSGLNKSILDQGWGEFFRQLGYKLEWAGGMLIAVPAMNTSRTCLACERISKLNRKTQAKFSCVECGYENHADLVGAINVYSRGMKMLRDQGQDTAQACVGRQTFSPDRLSSEPCGSGVSSRNYPAAAGPNSTSGLAA